MGIERAWDVDDTDDGDNAEEKGEEGAGWKKGDGGACGR